MPTLVVNLLDSIKPDGETMAVEFRKRIQQTDTVVNSSLLDTRKTGYHTVDRNRHVLVESSVVL